VRFLNSMLLL